VTILDKAEGIQKHWEKFTQLLEDTPHVLEKVESNRRASTATLSENPQKQKRLKEQRRSL
jgi:hypothetical protein